MTTPATEPASEECDCEAATFSALVACDCDASRLTCLRCAGTGVRPGDDRETGRGEDVPGPCPAHAPHDYRMWLARGRPGASAPDTEARSPVRPHRPAGERPRWADAPARRARAAIAILSNDRAAWAWADGTLGAAGYRVAVDDANRARLAALGSAAPDLLLVDLDGAEPDGLSVVRLATAALAHVPLIVTSAAERIDGEDIRRAVHAAGALLFVEKPWSVGLLLASVDVGLKVTASTRAYAPR